MVGDMFLEVSGAQEEFSAVFAAVELVPCVDQFVIAEVDGLTKLLPAKLTRIGTFP